MRLKNYYQLSFKNSSRTRKIFYLIFTLFFTTNLTAQTTAAGKVQTNYDIIVDSLNYKLFVNLNLETVIYNLLVVVADSSGHTLFLDNKYRFNGLYNHQFDLSMSGKGVYYLSITIDEERINKKITIK